MTDLYPSAVIARALGVGVRRVQQIARKEGIEKVGKMYIFNRDSALRLMQRPRRGRSSQ